MESNTLYNTLYNLSAEMLELENELEENGGEMTEELSARYEETAVSLAKKVDGYDALIRKLDDRADNISAEIKRLQALKKTTENAVKSVKSHLLYNMQLFGIDKLEGTFCKVSRRKTQAIDINEELFLQPYKAKIEAFEQSLPAYLSADIKISKTALKDSFKGTDVLPMGAERMTNESITIK